MFAIKSLTKQPFRRSGVSFSPEFWTLIEEPTQEQLNEPNLEVLEVSGPDDPALSGATVDAGRRVATLDFEVKLSPELASEIECLRRQIDELKAPTVRIWIDPSGMASIEAPEEVEVTFAFAESLPDGGRIVDIAGLIPEGGGDTPKPESKATGDPFEELRGLGDELKAALVAAGISDLAAARSASDEALLAISGIEARKLADLRAQLAALPV